MTNTAHATRTGKTVALATRDQAYNAWMLDAEFAGDLDDYIDIYFA